MERYQFFICLAQPSTGLGLVVGLGVAVGLGSSGPCATVIESGDSLSACVLETST